jgi:hypothetical protein
MQVEGDKVRIAGTTASNKAALPKTEQRRPLWLEPQIHLKDESKQENE